MNYPSMKIVIANSICNVAVSRFPHRQASVVAKKKAIFGDENRAQMSTYGRPYVDLFRTISRVYKYNYIETR